MQLVTEEEWAAIKGNHNLWLESKYRNGHRMEMFDRDFEEIPGIAFDDANFSKAILKRCRLVGKTIFGASFAGIDADECKFDNIHTNGNNFNAASFSNCSFRSAGLHGADFRWAKVNYCNFEGSILNNSNWMDSNIFRCNFGGARMENANLILAGQDVRGHLFYAFKRPWNPVTGEYYVIVKAGCRDFTLAQATKHWGSRNYKMNRPKELYADCLSLVRRIRELAKGKDWI